MGSFGETLRQARIDKGVSLADAERATFIRRRYLEALESEDFTTLPAVVYTRGFLRTYADYLGLSPQAMLDLYQPPRSRESAPRIRAATPALDRAREIPVGALVILGGAVLAVLMLLYLWNQYNSFSESLARAEATQLPTNVGRATPVAAIVGATRTAEAEPTETPPPPSPTPISGIQVVARFGAETWMQAWVDGVPQFAESIPAGEERTLAGEESVRLRVANAGALTVVVNGEEQPALGSEGQAVEASWGR
jgi:cytoskeleton protein RodZ